MLVYIYIYILIVHNRCMVCSCVILTWLKSSYFEEFTPLISTYRTSELNFHPEGLQARYSTLVEVNVEFVNGVINTFTLLYRSFQLYR